MSGGLRCARPRRSACRRTAGRHLGGGLPRVRRGATAGAGQWRLIDRDRTIRNTRLGSDFEYCPQREAGAADGGGHARDVAAAAARRGLGYRRTWSRTVGVIGDVGRFTVPDVGLYPNEAGQAPDSGVNEEHVHARVHGDLRAAGLALHPFGSARVSLLHAVIDRADAGVRIARGPHALEPAIEHFYPTFDGDSIWNAFSIEPTTDLRLGYRYDGAVRATASAWLRRYARQAGSTTAAVAAGDGDDMSSAGPAGAAYSGGVDASIEQRLTRSWRVRADALWDDGYGGRRVGGSGEAAWQRRDRDLWVRGRLVVLGVAPDDRARYVDTSAVVSTTWRIADAVAIHAIAEADVDAQHALQTRAIAVLDLAFAPEP